MEVVHIMARVSILLTLFLCTNTFVLGCLCHFPAAVSDGLLYSHTVFAGKVIDITIFSIKDSSDYYAAKEEHRNSNRVQERLSVAFERRFRRISFFCERVFKGEVTGNTVEVVTGMGNGDCGYNFEIDSTYIVYCQKNNKYLQKNAEVPAFLETDICQRTCMKRSEEIEELDSLVQRHLENLTESFRPRQQWQIVPELVGGYSMSIGQHIRDMHNHDELVVDEYWSGGKWRFEAPSRLHSLNQPVRYLCTYDSLLAEVVFSFERNNPEGSTLKPEDIEEAENVAKGVFSLCVRDYGENYIIYDADTSNKDFYSDYVVVVWDIGTVGKVILEYPCTENRIKIDSDIKKLSGVFTRLVFTADMSMGATWTVNHQHTAKSLGLE